MIAVSSGRTLTLRGWVLALVVLLGLFVLGTELFLTNNRLTEYTRHQRMHQGVMVLIQLTEQRRLVRRARAPCFASLRLCPLTGTVKMPGGKVSLIRLTGISRPG